MGFDRISLRPFMGSFVHMHKPFSRKIGEKDFR